MELILEKSLQSISFSMKIKIIPRSTIVRGNGVSLLKILQ